MFEDIVVLSAVRTPVGSFGGSLKDISTIDLGVIAVKEAIARAGIDSKEVEEIVIGCVGQYGLNPFLARLVGLKAGCSVESSGQTVNRLCASGLQAIVTAAMTVDHGDAAVCVAGGAENMSSFPYSSYTNRWGARMGNAVLVDDLTMALSEPVAGMEGTDIHIAITAENIAAKYGITREEADTYALAGQNKAKAAIQAGKFKDEIVPVEVKEKKQVRLFDTDEHPRETSKESLAKLRTIVKKDGVVTAGNASGINDAAAAMVITTGAKAKEMGCQPIAKIIDYAVAGVDPDYMGMGPVASTKKLLKKVNLPLSEIGLVELNEAFATQAIACIKGLNLNPDIVNVNGSGIALGHPIGATGAVISVKLLFEMKRRGVKYGISTLCIGGGQGLSVLFECL
ncbi:acetyl-CoA C-acyltransferase [Anaerocolumna sedimenticola]|uniref:Acetyl-CoA acetyltransferase n=1 Tax=Anaerocolumna sedimenticola TaxID=2696063 RepID=A0A6P1THU1_9FIRM|nr:thiolase family protein [Anaerocolumna sedimenticola]QHQ59659.1 acetyl-CoA C-acyltransferase [Anaerocolumna sedimenticola]